VHLPPKETAGLTLFADQTPDSKESGVFIPLS
jgi:hypothetical protein